MLEFREVTLDDKIWIDEILSKAGYISADSAFGTMYVWRKAYGLKVANYKGFLLRFYDGSEAGYGFPLGEGDLIGAVETLIEHAKSQNINFKFIGVSESSIHALESLMPGKFLFEHIRDRDDYIYKTDDLINLVGKKYHSKRNHISKFTRENNWKYEDINVSNLIDCKKLAQEWYEESTSEDSESLKKENEAIMLAISHFNELNFQGGIIKVDGKPVAFTMGEAISKDVFVVHFEKALNKYAEAYAVLNREFAKNGLSGYEFINREEDLGLKGLRRAKLSYHPIALLKKYKVTLR